MLDSIKKLNGALAGKKTYVINGIAIISAIGAYLVGDLSLVKTAAAVWGAATAMTIRHGISNA